MNGITNSLFTSSKMPQRLLIIHLLIIVLAGVFIYSNTFNSPFIFDDEYYIVSNPAITTPRFFINISKLETIIMNEQVKHFFHTRFITFFTFMLNYQLHGLDVTGYHIVNLTIHLLNALLVYWLVVLTMQTAFFRVRGQNSEKAISSEQLAVSNKLTANRYPLTAGISLFPTSYSLLALFSALLFVAHPLQTQAVTYIVQRFTSLATLFYLLSLVLYIKWRIQKSEFRSQNSEEAISSEQLAVSNKLTANCYLLYTASLVSAVLAMKTKEIAFTLPIIITLYEFSFFMLNTERKIPPHPPLTKGGWGDFYSSRIAPAYRTGRHHASRFLYLLPFLLTMLIIPLSLMGVNDRMDNLAEDLNEITKSGTSMSRWDYLFTEFRVIVTYIRLLFLPVNQNLDYDYPIYTSFLNPNVFLSFLFLLSIFGLGVYMFYCSKNPPPSLPTGQAGPFDKGGIKGGCSLFTVHCSRITAFGISWFFITLSVESSIIPITDVIFEHRVYLPSIGLIIAFVSAVFYAFSRITHHACLPDRQALRITVLLLAAILIVFSIAAYQRNAVWQDRIRFWEDVAGKSPNKARTHNNLGLAYVDKGLYEEAIKKYQIAVKLKPDYAEAYDNLGMAYEEQGLYEEAIKEYQTAVKINPLFDLAHNDLGVVYGKLGLYEEAIKEYQIAVKINPDNALAYDNLQLIYKKLGR
ncbi:MAG: tetratricopeptide repeat protein [Nitrospirae bacterium]|nr:tetratricopeptide repeat protein [Nitrospirota bacterium]